jgi:hypothetical protein
MVPDTLMVPCTLLLTYFKTIVDKEKLGNFFPAQLSGTENMECSYWI